MVGTTLSTKNTTINHEENKNNGGHNVVTTIVFIFLTIYSGVLGAQCSDHHCFYFPHDL
jgi:hypothetical protein